MAKKQLAVQPLPDSVLGLPGLIQTALSLLEVATAPLSKRQGAVLWVLELHGKADAHGHRSLRTTDVVSKFQSWFAIGMSSAASSVAREVRALEPVYITERRDGVRRLSLTPEGSDLMVKQRARLVGYAERLFAAAKVDQPAETDFWRHVQLLATVATVDYSPVSAASSEALPQAGVECAVRRKS